MNFRLVKNIRTKIGGSIEPPIFFCFLLFSRKCSFFRDFAFAFIYPYWGLFSSFFRSDYMFDHNWFFKVKTG